MTLFARRDVEEYTDSLERYLPGGRLFESRSLKNSNFRLLLRGMAGELFRANGLLREYDILPDKTEKFLAEWESTLGIPDSCFKGTGSIEERRLHILVKLAALGVQTEEDFVNLAAEFGITVKIAHTEEEGGVFPLEFQNDILPHGILFFPEAQAARFTIFVLVDIALENKFPLDFLAIGGEVVLPGIPFGTSELGIVECLFQKLKPVNCNLIFRQV